MVNGSHIVYVNGNYKGDRCDWQAYAGFSSGNPDNMYYKELAEEGQDITKSQEEEMKLCVKR